MARGKKKDIIYVSYTDARSRKQCGVIVHLQKQEESKEMREVARIDLRPVHSVDSAEGSVSGHGFLMAS